MNIGDLVKVADCDPPFALMDECSCFLCCAGSNRIGIIKSVGSMNSYMVQFDCGEMRFDKFDFALGDIEVISRGNV